MPSLTILKAGLMTSIQDMGRKGFAYYAIPNAGVMDKESACQALAFLDLSDTHPLIECTSLAPHIQFNGTTQIALAGADFSWQLNDIPIPANGILSVQTGDILKGKFSKNGMRAYIAINGKLRLQKIYSSYATYTNAKLGGLNGSLLDVGDVLQWENYPNTTSKSVIPDSVLDVRTIIIKAGPEFDLLSLEAKRILTSSFYQISSDSNRMGLRLLGERLESSTYQLKYSLAVLPGFIQLPPSGLPIVLLQDGQTSGGYPRIAYIPERFLRQINQIPLSQKFRFQLG